MAEIFTWRNFSNVDLSDPFFDSLKKDYPEFSEWFMRKSVAGARALVYTDDEGIGAFLYLKEETEEIVTRERVLPAIPRIKIGTLKLAERARGQRLGEGAIGVALWHWQAQKVSDIYITVFQEHESLINLLFRFGFSIVGTNQRGELVLIKQRSSLNYSTPYLSFPFITPHFEKAGIIPVKAEFHDRLFPYSELKGNSIEVEEEAALKGITKIYIGAPQNPINLKPGDPIYIYRIDNSTGQPTYRSAVTSFCTITSLTVIRNRYSSIVSKEKYLHLAGNKTVFTLRELEAIYEKPNLIMIEMVYNGFFGKGHNVIHRRLADNGFFPRYPYEIEYTKEDFMNILRMGNVDVQNVIID